MNIMCIVHWIYLIPDNALQKFNDTIKTNNIKRNSRERNKRKLFSGFNLSFHLVLFTHVLSIKP